MSDMSFSFDQKEINEFIDRADESHDMLISIISAKYPGDSKTNLFLATQFGVPTTNAPVTNVAILPKGCPNPPGWGKVAQPVITHEELLGLPKFIILAADKTKLVNSGAPKDAQLFASIMSFITAGTQQVKLSFPSLNLDAQLL